MNHVPWLIYTQIPQINKSCHTHMKGKVVTQRCTQIWQTNQSYHTRTKDKGNYTNTFVFIHPRCVCARENVGAGVSVSALCVCVNVCESVSVCTFVHIPPREARRWIGQINHVTHICVSHTYERQPGARGTRMDRCLWHFFIFLFHIMIETHFHVWYDPTHPQINHVTHFCPYLPTLCMCVRECGCGCECECECIMCVCEGVWVSVCVCVCTFVPIEPRASCPVIPMLVLQPQTTTPPTRDPRAHTHTSENLSE